MDITVNKTWDDLDNKFGFRPDSITVRLKANGKEVKTARIIGIGNDWKYTFSNLEEYSNGEKIKYTITEDVVPYYTTTIVDNGNNTFNITNKIIPMGGSENEPPTQGGTVILQSANPATRSKDYTLIYDTMIATAIVAIAIVTKNERDRDKRIRILNSTRIKFK
ncbi:MAG: Cna B-type domain-containing protein [Clostridia bacterium]|nr:Cna B-type domain-containing protein [Clostridia bacterium]